MAALSLFAASLVLLQLGGFIQLDDTSGFGSDRWNLPLGLLALFLAAVALGVALSERTARRALGGAWAVLAVALVVLSLTDDGFRFVWGGDEGELVMFMVGLALGAAALLTPTLYVRRPAGDFVRDPEPPASGWARTVGYLCATVIAMYLAFHIGIRHFKSTQCVGTGGECDVAVLEGLLWVVVTFFLGIVAITANEWRLRRRRPRKVSLRNAAG